MQALQGKPLTIYGTGKQTRSFCYVDDLIKAFIALMATQSDFTGPVNLGNHEEITVLELAEKIIELTGSNSRIQSMPRPADDPKQRQPDLQLARVHLNWQPVIPIDIGLGRTIEYFDNLLTSSIS